MTDEPRSPERPVRPATPPTRASRRPTTRASRFATHAPKSFLERNRRPLLGAIGLAALLAIGSLIAFNAAQPAYACAEQWIAPASTIAPAPGASARIGYIQPDLGKNHIEVGQSVRYVLCPPASGRHYNQTNLGPIKPQIYGPDDTANPQGWLHNLEHGGIVILYRCPGDSCTDAGQATLRQFYQTFPASPICNLPATNAGAGLVIARFDQMGYPMVAILWGQILPLQTFDQALILTFFKNQAERSNPEPACTAPTASPAATGTAVPSASPATTPSPAATGSAAPSASPATTPSPAATGSAAPSASPATSPQPS